VLHRYAVFFSPLHLKISPKAAGFLYLRTIFWPGELLMDRYEGFYSPSFAEVYRKALQHIGSLQRPYSRKNVYLPRRVAFGVRDNI
jgi:hypothetical protein